MSGGPPTTRASDYWIMDEPNYQRMPDADDERVRVTVGEFPTEAFPCPACGQMLAPSCRVCVACKSVIDPAKIIRPTGGAASRAARIPPPEPKRESVRYPWRIFFTVLVISFCLALLAEKYLGEDKAQLAMGGIQMLAGVWVFFDALQGRIPRPLRWAVGSMLLFALVFPWYLARRSRPRASVPFVEAEMGPVTRVLLLGLLLLVLASLILYFVKGPPPVNPPHPPSKLQKTAVMTLPRDLANPRQWKV